ncbi:MAG: hypothetical protein A3D96_05715 [Chlamydiae bacterium RIFCSPHIGHO2_12_FULL_44_59]|nr:MAG: hypothetical protein A2796_03545 [Chlamydiae bacterium RIFCSPHIGHO2_01_FULL_44_39]OGN59117.1 MAG: hypothetical protein A3C42_02560 [Chlamydiae bacterium RIFCSPHIGHO2_02_FULL_45_9]OGN61128.1 MAG: hypothetical protein A3D96_05715 [Chlamydiae bacterium RIFCSPHIGHO2_12_FULL_44_59]OGN65598.1 MAG: hypothetical protein A2978_06520 [Chlamydiae bacterium RIFCSPLOWO2_01_FULL_44_52]OGN68075.1 MAG: hypothetical protein A3I67_05190 [Chlamydiae bacterium RIFCSPLOWO2_02_FULL_45_22]OGN68964.1 MAG: hyp
MNIQRPEPQLQEDRALYFLGVGTVLATAHALMSTVPSTISLSLWGLGVYALWRNPPTILKEVTVLVGAFVGASYGLSLSTKAPLDVKIVSVGLRAIAGATVGFWTPELYRWCCGDFR